MCLIYVSLPIISDAVLMSNPNTTRSQVENVLGYAMPKKEWYCVQEKHRR